MSDFPEPQNYRKGISASHFRFLDSFLLDENPHLFILKKEKNQYLYDVDGNKYVDFFLNNGTVLLGHSHPVINHLIKDAISYSTESVFLNKFYYKTVKLFKSIINFGGIAFYSSFNRAVFEILLYLKVERLAVNSRYLFYLMEKCFPFVKAEIVKKGVQYDLILFEPLNFGEDLSIFPIDNYNAKFKVSVENRCAFRIRDGFIHDLKTADFIVAGNIIANGMDCAVVLSRNRIKGEILPVYKTVAIQSTLKYLIRHRDISYPALNLPFLKFQNRSIFKFDRNIDTEKLLPYGIFFSGDTGFLSYLHTENDIKRLKKALEANFFS